MATMNISLPNPMRNWVQDRIDEGQYASSSDYVRDLIRKDQARNTKIEALQAAITEGLKSNDIENFDIKAFKKRMTEGQHAIHSKGTSSKRHGRDLEIYC
ncbi:MAG: type II toxin-antitoxin system ParD family antitoxin [Proteobacteria bacterium]|nr:type II toxin-antitoxin system ParD family antitoxin [Pseudomonadota bacterium]